jgi:hypothetical protein
MPTTIRIVTCFLLGPTQGYVRRHSDRNIHSNFRILYMIT